MLRLRPYQDKDAKIILSWIRDEESFWLWAADKYECYPIQEEDMNRYYHLREKTEEFFAMTAEDESGIAGHLMMSFLDRERTVLRFGCIIVDENKRGKGYGKQMLQLAMQYAFDTLKAQKISICVFDQNEAASHCYQSLGFRETGRVERMQLMNQAWNYRELERVK